jgi:hypothetical protein
MMSNEKGEKKKRKKRVSLFDTAEKELIWY